MAENDVSNKADQVNIEEWLNQPVGDQDFTEVEFDELDEFSERFTKIGIFSSSITLNLSNQISDILRQLTTYPLQETATQLTGLNALTAGNIVTDFGEFYHFPRVTELASVVNPMPMSSLHIAADSWATSVAGLVAQQLDSESLVFPVDPSVFVEGVSDIGAATSIHFTSPYPAFTNTSVEIHDSSSPADTTDSRASFTTPTQTNDIGYFRHCILPLVDYTLDRTVEGSRVRELEPRHRAAITWSVYLFMSLHPELAEPGMELTLSLALANLIDFGANSR